MKSGKRPSPLGRGRVKATLGIAVVAAVLGVAAAPIAAYAANYNYATSVATAENVIRQTASGHSMKGAGGYVVSTGVRFHLNNAAGAGYSLGSTHSDNTNAILSLGHPRYSPAYSNCWWDYIHGSSSTIIGTTCWYTS